jgi:hypothetical protein
MKAEDEVLKVYPKAISTLHGIFSDRVIIVIPPFNTEMDGFWGKHLSDHFYTADEAWADAWRRIQAECAAEQRAAEGATEKP